MLSHAGFSGAAASLHLSTSALANDMHVSMQHYQCGVEMIRRDLLTGHWKPYIDRAMSLKPCYDGGTNGGEVY